MRRSSMKLSADTEHNTDPNMIITIVSIGRKLLPPLVNVSDICGRCIYSRTRCGVPFGRGKGTAHFFSGIIGLKSIAAVSAASDHKRVSLLARVVLLD